MKLVSAHITNFRCVEDSEEFTLDQVTCLVGKNEAGKTTILKALYGIKPWDSTVNQYDRERDYRYVCKRDGVPCHVVIDEAEAEVVRMLYRWLIDEQMSVRQIVKRLVGGPWRPRCGKRLWSKCVVHHMLSDPFYMGVAYANRVAYVVGRIDEGLMGIPAERSSLGGLAPALAGK